VVKHGEGEGLALGVSPEVGLEPEGVDCRNKGLDDVERGSGNGRVLKINRKKSFII
jgi:hypothetical protein